jgi:hypothetical protein
VSKLSISCPITEISSHSKILFQICSIFSNILSGLAYLLTSKPNNLPNIGKRNIDTTVIITPIIAYLIVLIAGFILSSLPPDNISNNPHHKMKTIDSIHAKSTNNEIDKSIKSQNSIASQNNGLCVVVVNANAFSIIIIY